VLRTCVDVFLPRFDAWRELPPGPPGTVGIHEIVILDPVPADSGRLDLLRRIVQHKPRDAPGGLLPLRFQAAQGFGGERAFPKDLVAVGGIDR